MPLARLLGLLRFSLRCSSPVAFASHHRAVRVAELAVPAVGAGDREAEAFQRTHGLLAGDHG